jgi:NADH:ubiquinone oxidoreductase subunit 6 (subunit J)
MAAIEVIVFIVAAGVAFAVVITIIVIIGVRQEERYLTLTHRTAPGAIAQLARMVLGRYVRKEQDARIERRDPDDPMSSRERTTSSRS